MNILERSLVSIILFTSRFIGVLAFVAALTFVFFDNGIASGRKTPLPTWERYFVIAVLIVSGIGCFCFARWIGRSRELNVKK